MNGQLIRLGTDSTLTNAIWNERSLEPAVRTAILSRCKPGMTVVDVGANIGCYTLQMAALLGPGGRVMAAEPNPSMVRQLESNLALNGRTNVTVAEAALCDQDGTAEFCFPETACEAYGSLHPNSLFGTAFRSPVRTEKLSTSLGSLGSSSVDLIKIDVEGAELSVLSGAERVSSTVKPVLIFEAAESLGQAFGHTVFDTRSLLERFRPNTDRARVWKLARAIIVRTTKSRKPPRLDPSSDETLTQNDEGVTPHNSQCGSSPQRRHRSSEYSLQTPQLHAR